MRIAHVVWSLTTGGIETMLVDIVNEQVKYCKVWIFIINNHYNKELLLTINPKVNVILFNRKPGSKNVIPLVKLNLSLLRYRPDVIHCHLANLSRVIWLPFKKVLTIHNTHSNPEFWGSFNKLFCISKAVKNYAATQGFPNGVVVYNGIHTDVIPKRTLPFPDIRKTCKCVCVGRLHPMKGQDVLIEAVNILVNKRKKTGFLLDLIGDGESKSELQALVCKYGLEPNIHFLGKQQREEFYPKLKDYDLFVLPSVSEGFGLTLAEACAAKIPVITCDLEGPMEVIANGRYGCSFEAGNANSLADALVNHIERGINVEQVEGAYNYVRSHFDVRATACEYVKRYEQVLQ